MSKAKLSEIIGALELQFDDLTYFLNKETGEVVGIHDEEFTPTEDGEPLENYPDWQQERIVIAGDILFSTGKYIALPAKFEVNEYAMMERFCWSLEDGRLSKILSHSIRGRGAFRRFKDTVHRLGIQGDSQRMVRGQWG